MFRQSQNLTHTQASAKHVREMTMKKNILIGAVGALLLGPTAVLAADLPMKAAPPAPPPYDWTGFYIGATAGGSLGNSDQVDQATRLSFANGYNIKGGLGGGTLGYNWQVSRFLVVGFEGDGSWGSEYGSNTDLGTLGNPAFLSFTKETWLATARLRVGYAVDNLLFYGTGGYAAAGTDFGVKNSATLALVATGSSTRSGWTGGAGLEWGFAPNWSTKFEILYSQFDSVAFNVTVPGPGPNRSVPLNDTVARFGVNYRFGGGPVVARY
jgi:outer membrane immunogenic protein